MAELPNADDLLNEIENESADDVKLLAVIEYTHLVLEAAAEDIQELKINAGSVLGERLNRTVDQCSAEIRKLKEKV